MKKIIPPKPIRQVNHRAVLGLEVGVSHQGEAVDLDVEHLHLPGRHGAGLALVLLVGLQVGPQPLLLEALVRVVAIVHLIQAWNQSTQR